jgi:hypothetical protein
MPALNSPGFDPAGLHAVVDPTRQSRLPGGYATQGQAVSAPYAEANVRAAQKINPMNAASQDPSVGDKVDAFLRQLGGSDEEIV